MWEIPGLGRYPGEGNGNPLLYFCWKITWMEEPGSLQSMGHKELDTTEQLHCCCEFHSRNGGNLPWPVDFRGDLKKRQRLVIRIPISRSSIPGRKARMPPGCKSPDRDLRPLKPSSTPSSLLEYGTWTHTHTHTHTHRTYHTLTIFFVLCLLSLFSPFFTHTHTHTHNLLEIDFHLSLSVPYTWCLEQCMEYSRSSIDNSVILNELTVLPCWICNNGCCWRGTRAGWKTEYEEDFLFSVYPFVPFKFYFLKSFLFCIRVETIIKLCCGSFKWTAKGFSQHTHVSILPQTPLLSRLPHNIEQSSMCYTILVAYPF